MRIYLNHKAFKNRFQTSLLLPGSDWTTANSLRHNDADTYFAMKIDHHWKIPYSSAQPYLCHDQHQCILTFHKSIWCCSLEIIPISILINTFHPIYTKCLEQSGRSPKVVALFLLKTLVAIWHDFFNCMIQSKSSQIIQESTIIIII